MHFKLNLIYYSINILKYLINLLFKNEKVLIYNLKMDRTKTDSPQNELANEVEHKIEKEVIQPASLRLLYRYITGKYWIMLIIAIINAIVAGATNPARLVLVRDSFNEVSENSNLNEMADGLRDKIKWFAMIAAIGGVWCYIFWIIFIIIGSKISYELKWRYLKAVLSQDWAWYEKQNIEELPTQINVNITEVENATGKTTGFILYSFGAFFGGIGWSFFIGALLAWWFLIIIPYMIFWGMSRGILLIKGNEKNRKGLWKEWSWCWTSSNEYRIRCCPVPLWICKNLGLWKNFQQKILSKKWCLWIYYELNLLIFVCFFYLNTMK